jgi:hypothetical protein
MYERWSSTTAVLPPPLDRPVWVHLDVLYGPPESPDPIADPAPGGLLVATGRVPGLLKRWTRAVDGRWVRLSTRFGVDRWPLCLQTALARSSSADPDGVLASRIASR